MHTHAHTCTHMLTYMHTHAHTCIHTCTHMHTYMHTHPIFVVLVDPGKLTLNFDPLSSSPLMGYVDDHAVGVVTVTVTAKPPHKGKGEHEGIYMHAHACTDIYAVPQGMLGDGFRYVWARANSRSSYLWMEGTRGRGMGYTHSLCTTCSKMWYVHVACGMWHVTCDMLHVICCSWC